MTKIDRVEDLPEWFDLKKYDKCESFGAADWLRQLDIRSYLLSRCPDYPDAFQPMPELFSYLNTSHEEYLAGRRREWRFLINPYMEALRADPLGFSPSQIDNEFFEWKRKAIQPVRGAVFDDLSFALHVAIAAYCEGEEQMCAQLRGWDLMAHDLQAGASYLAAERKNDLPYPLAGPAYKLASEELSNTLVEPPEWGTLISVDLEAPDAVLIESFRDWVREARVRQKCTGPKGRKFYYDRWARYGLLPYLDLRTWSLETGIHIPDRVMSAAISHYDAGEANLRKTIVPLAADLIRDMSGLQALAGHEEAAAKRSGSETFDS